MGDDSTILNFKMLTLWTSSDGKSLICLPGVLLEN